MLWNGVHQADVMAVTNDRRTPLHYAAISGHVSVVKALVELGANVNAMNKDGCVPLASAPAPLASSPPPL
eukprot:2573841-Pyramimonas_sp.AAC.1